MNWFAIFGCVVTDVALIALVVHMKNRPRYKIVIHMMHGEPIVWLTHLDWKHVQKHLPPCDSYIDGNRVKAYEVTPP